MSTENINNERPTTIQYYKNEFIIYYGQNNDEIENQIDELNIYNLALIGGIDISNLVIPDSIECLLLMDGFDQVINKGFIPESISELFILDIKCDLVKDSLPNSIIWLEFGNNYSKSINKDILPSSSLEVLYLRDIKTTTPITLDSLPNSLEKLYLYDGFSQAINELPSNLKNLYCYNINSTNLFTSSSSNNSNIKLLYLGNGFKSQSSSSNEQDDDIIIPSSVELLYLCDIKSKLTNKSISKESKIKSIYLNEGYNQSTIIPIPSNIKLLNLYVFNIKQPLEFSDENSSNIESIHLMPGFNQDIKNLKNCKTLKNLIIHDLNKPLNKDDLSLNLQLESLQFGNLKFELTNQSIPNNGNIKTLHFGNGFKHSLSSGAIIPNGIIDLYIGDIEQPLTYNCILPTIETLKNIYISINQYTHSLDNLKQDLLNNNLNNKIQIKLI